MAGLVKQATASAVKSSALVGGLRAAVASNASQVARQGANAAVRNASGRAVAQAPSLATQVQQSPIKNGLLRQFDAHLRAQVLGTTNHMLGGMNSQRYYSTDSKSGGGASKSPNVAEGPSLPVTGTDFEKGTPSDLRSVKTSDFSVGKSKTGGYPVIGDGIDFKTTIFDIPWTTKDITDLQARLWNVDKMAFLPVRPAQPLTGSLKVLSDIAQEGAHKLADGRPGLLAKNELRKAVEQLPKTLLDDFLPLLRQFKDTQDSDKKAELAHKISDVSFWAHWLVQQYKFEGLFHGEEKSADIIPAPLSQLYVASNAALGRHNEFTYDVYTLSSASLPDYRLSSADYDDPEKIKAFVKDIKNTVGFMDITEDEQYFRQIHTAMEMEMIDVKAGINQVLWGNEDGWDKIVEGARRAHLIFKTMTRGSDPDKYPAIRVGIFGKLGGKNSVFPPHYEFYEGTGTDVFVKDGKVTLGSYPGVRPGQTGANSSLYKLLDLFIGVAAHRQAYPDDAESLERMESVMKGDRPVTDLNPNAVRMLQDAFDIFTRPIAHLDDLRTLHSIIQDRKVLETASDSAKIKMLELAKWVGKHRLQHARYVLRYIYQTARHGKQSQAAGTGGAPNSARFLAQFLEDTIVPARDAITQLRDKKTLSDTDHQKVDKLEFEFQQMEAEMKAIVSKGDEILTRETAEKTVK